MIVPTSLTQEHILTGNAESAELRCGLLYRIEGHLNVGAFQSALNVIVARHDALRMTFPRHLRPVYASKSSLSNWPLMVVTAQDVASAGEYAHEQLAQIIGRPHDVEAGPLVMGVLVLVNPTLSYFGCLRHMLVWDGFSIGIFLKDLEHAYRALCSGKNPSFADRKSFCELAAYERSNMAASSSVRRLAYWFDLFDRYGPVPELSLKSSVLSSGASIEAQSFTEDIAVPHAVAQRLSALWRVKQVSPFVGLLSAIFLALRRHSMRDVIGAKISESGRYSLDSATAMGVFGSGLPFWVELGLGDTYDTALKKVKSGMHVFAENALPLRHILNEYLAQKSRLPDFDVAQFVQQRTMPALRIAMSPRETSAPIAWCDLTLYPQTPPFSERSSPGFLINIAKGSRGWGFGSIFASESYAAKGVRSILEDAVDIVSSQVI